MEEFCWRGAPNETKEGAMTIIDHQRRCTVDPMRTGPVTVIRQSEVQHGHVPKTVDTPEQALGGAPVLRLVVPERARGVGFLNHDCQGRQNGLEDVRQWAAEERFGGTANPGGQRRRDRLNGRGLPGFNRYQYFRCNGHELPTDARR